MALCRHAVFFQTRVLTNSEKEKIQKYFKIRRRSGGGECGPVEDNTDNTYKISFLEQEAQQRILDRKEHVIDLAAGQLCISLFTENDTPKAKENRHSAECLQCTEMQFTLVEEEFGREIKLSSPHVKLTRQGSGTPVFEGPEAEVEAARTTLQELVKKIRQRSLQLPAPLLAFLASSGALQTYQTRFKQSLRSPVMLEVGPDLVLSSLTTEALEEAAAALERDLTVETVVLEQAETESPEIATLRETLDCALQQSNHSVPRVELSYGTPSQSNPHMPVQVVGYRQDVERLRQVLLNYKLNQADISDFMNLPNSFVVDHLFQVLELLGVQYTGLRMMPIHLPGPGVQFTGPRQMVQEFRKRLASGIGSLITKDFNVEGPGALKYFRGEGMDSIALLESSHKVMVFFSSDQSQVFVSASQSASTISITLPVPSLTLPDYSRNKIHLEVVLGQLENQQVDAMVAPMMRKTLTATNIGKAIAQKAGDQFQRNFDCSRKCQDSLKPGDVLEVEGTPSLGCQKVLFIECVPSDALRGNSEKAVQNGLRRALELCEHHAFSSVAFPIIGPEQVLSIPANEAAQILADEIVRFGKLGPRTLSTVQIVIHPDYSDSTEVFQEVCQKLSTYMVNIDTGQAIFQSLTSDLDEITLPVGGIKLHLVFGDITNETTDVVVNTTDFQNFDTAVCRDILTLAGPDVKRSLQSAQVKRGEIFTSSSGSFPCKAIMHICGQKDPAVIQGLARDILLLCERKKYLSVAIPAICAGTGEMDPRLVADAILNGVKAAVCSHALQHLSTVRLVLLKINVFQHFQAAAQAIIGVPAIPTSPGHLRATRVPVHQSPLQSLKSDLSPLLPSSPRACTPAAFTLLGTSAQDVSSVSAGLQRAYTSHCSEHTLAPEELAALSHAELQDLAERVNSLGVQLEPSGPGSGAGVVLRGLTEGVKEVRDVMQGALRRQMVERDQRELFTHVVWCIMGQRGDWERFPKEANQKLEMGDVSGGVIDAHGYCWKVDLRQMRATATGLGRVADIKRLQNLPDFKVPVYWDSLDAYGALQMIPLESSSAEYRRVKRDFKRTAKKTVLKIERVQNVHLRRAFEVQRQQLEDKNGSPVGAGEKMLYHGTTAQACQSIMKNGFNRSFAGQNATVYGLGTYFAVNASYSANPTYSRPEADGTQLMFVARVLAGSYTLGGSDMRVPPPVSPQQPDIRFDSLVDNHQNPSMFVVFHDSQAYPDYLITFKDNSSTTGLFDLGIFRHFF
ncbi:protein mono-ADP-ribosyltransferase PARP14-like [Sardina pilchardus]|uniref:protein mono-ADP-ribosyltransferase PARP14-like n=1 Tax=Sardina pilchardus TaxID=27697 RepID=UPI002E0E5D74